MTIANARARAQETSPTDRGPGIVAPRGASAAALGAHHGIRLLLQVQSLLMVLYSVLLLVPDVPMHDSIRDGLLGNLVFVLPAVVMLARGWYFPDDRGWSWCLAAAVVSFLAGNLIYVFWVVQLDVPPFPSWADAGFLSLFPFVIMAILLSMRERVGRLRGAVLLDGLACGLAAALAASFAVLPLMHTFGGGPVQVVVATTYPAGDVVIIAMVIGVLVATGGRPGSFYAYLAVGLGVFALADVVYGYRVANDTYAVGTPLDALWAVGATLMAHGAWRPRAERVLAGVGLSSLWVISVSSLVATGVLVVGSQVTLPLVIIVLAVATLLASAARTAVSFARVRDMAVIRRQAMTDDLTGVANRRALCELIDLSLESRDSGGVVGLALLDLDRFKEVNDSLGHQVGDRLLQVVSGRLTTALTAIDPEMMLARLGGDEFAILAPHAVDADAVVATVELVLEALLEPVPLEGSMSVHVRASTGVALAPGHAETRSDLLRCADLAMYAAKRSSGEVRLFQPEMSTGTRERLRLAEDLHRAIRQRELVVHYQPQVDLLGNVRGVEGLVRWDRPGKGLMMPDSFLPVAEDHLLMPSVTSIVLDIVLSDAASLRWAGHVLSVAVNLSVGDLLDERLPDVVRAKLDEHGVRAADLTLEITETNVMSDPLMAQATLERLRALGVQLSVDDYGTGHCSLAYLRSLPVQELKLDRSFVTGMALDEKAAAIVRSSVDLAHSLGMRMVAEGVEDARAADLLAAAGCDLAQGWYFARPMPVSDLLEWLQLHRVGALAGTTTKNGG